MSLYVVEQEQERVLEYDGREPRGKYVLGAAGGIGTRDPVN